jgi:hypothetical protein
MHGLVSPLQASPAATSQPIESITLIPMGAARLRISVIPTFAAAGGTRWVPPRLPKPTWPASASHVFRGDSVAALSDGLVPKSSSDQSVPRFTWWDHKGSLEWVQYDLASPKLATTAEVYWFDDRDLKGGCRVPISWRLLYLDGDRWREVETSAYETRLDRFSVVKFKPVRAQKWRIEAKLQPNFSAGIVEWVLK